MKNLIFLSLFMIPVITSGQVVKTNIKIDSVSIVKPESENEIIDTSGFCTLEKFNSPDDAIVYIYRMKSMVGAAVAWLIEVDNKTVAHLKTKEYIVVHINTTQKIHYFRYPNLSYNYTNFKPNTYYYVRFKGFDINTGYLNSIELKEISALKLTKPIKN